MKSARLELFWAEKIKLAQFIIHSTEAILNTKDKNFQESKDELLQSIHSIVHNDKRFFGYLTFSLRLSSILPFPRIKELEIEKDLTEVRDLYPIPALPTQLSTIYIRRAEFIDWEECSSYSEIWKYWKQVLGDIEKILMGISEEKESSSRYFSIRGLRSLVGGLNSSTAKNYHLFVTDITPR